MQTKYHKIHGPFKRDMTKSHKPFIMSEWSLDVFKDLQNYKWDFWEKIDGTNIRITPDDGNVIFQGRTDAAEIPKPLLQHLTETFTYEKIINVFSNETGAVPQYITLYGEGYGKGIQKIGKHYRDDQGFILFDVNVNGIWLTKQSTMDIAKKLNIPHVPYIDSGTLWDGMYLVKEKNGLSGSVLADTPCIPEGVIAIPCGDLLDRMGHRIITKLKHVDFKDLTNENTQDHSKRPE